MSHEVVKSVRGRDYRYRVESYRDPESGKVRGRWTYLGRVEPGGGLTVPAPRRPALTREKLLDALVDLLDTQEFGAITASRIAAQAGVAHGTFYRYFSDKQGALRAAVERIREAFERTRPDFDAPLGSLAEERTRVRNWVESMLRTSLDRPGLLREWYATLATDEAFQAQRAARRAKLLPRFAAYMERLTAAGLGLVEHPNELALALVTAIDGAFQGFVLSRQPFDATTILGLADLFDRAIFGVPPAL